MPGVDASSEQRVGTKTEDCQDLGLHFGLLGVKGVNRDFE